MKTKGATGSLSASAGLKETLADKLPDFDELSRVVAPQMTVEATFLEQRSEGSGASERARSFAALSMALIRSDDNSSMIRLKICLLFLLFCVLQIASLSRAQSIPSTPWPA